MYNGRSSFGCSKSNKICFDRSFAKFELILVQVSLLYIGLFCCEIYEPVADVFSDERFFSIGAIGPEGLSIVDFLPLIDLFGGDISNRLNKLF